MTDTLAGTAVRRPPLTELLERVRGTVDLGLPDQEAADEVGRHLKQALARPGLLASAQRRGSPDGYTQHVLHVEPGGSFSVVALVWLPGQTTFIHDHVSWCTVGVYEGCETEITYRTAGPGSRKALVEIDRTLNPAGSVSAIAPPGDIHRVFNSGTSKAISLHVYGADVGVLGSSIRRTY